MDLIVSAHGYVIGIAIMGSWALIMLLALGLRAFAADAEAGWFWKIVSAAQVLLGAQLVFGLVLWAIRGRLPGDELIDQVFHPLYNFVFPVVVLVVAHRASGDGRAHPFTAFATAGLVIFGLTARGFTAQVFG
jgi:hypothetical protein